VCVVDWVVNGQHKDAENWDSTMQTSTSPVSVNHTAHILMSSRPINWDVK